MITQNKTLGSFTFFTFVSSFGETLAGWWPFVTIIHNKMDRFTCFLHVYLFRGFIFNTPFSPQFIFQLKRQTLFLSKIKGQTVLQTEIGKPPRAYVSHYCRWTTFKGPILCENDAISGF